MSSNNKVWWCLECAKPEKKVATIKLHCGCKVEKDSEEHLLAIVDEDGKKWCGDCYESDSDDESDNEEVIDSKKCITCGYSEPLYKFTDFIDGKEVMTDECRGCYVEAM